MSSMTTRPYQNHLQSSADLVTSYEATRTGFIMLALEKNRRATPFISEARALLEAASSAKIPTDLLEIKGIEMALETAAGISDKASNNLKKEDREEAVRGLIKSFLEPAGEKFVEELVFRFLLTRGDSLGGAMRNAGGALAQKKLTRTVISTLRIAGISYHWQHSKSRTWAAMTDDDSDIELYLRGLSWHSGNGNRTLIYNLTVPLFQNNVDMCLFNLTPSELKATKCKTYDAYIALGELKGGIDPAGADEHWKTARTALDRIRESFSSVGTSPLTFFIGAAIATNMATEIWNQLENGILSNAANLNEESQVISISHWICNL